MGNEGINKLAGVLQSRMKKINDKPQVLDFGSIQNDKSLITNHFPKAIPKNGYTVCRSALERTETGYTLKAGSRVLVAWAGDEPCIVDTIIPGSSV